MAAQHNGAEDERGGHPGPRQPSDADAAGPRPHGKGGKRRGWSGDGPRNRKLHLKLSQAEHAAVAEVADRLGMERGAWAAEMVVRMARGQLQPLPSDYRDLQAALVEYRTHVVDAGVLAKQIVTYAHHTGAFADDAGRLLERIETLLDQVDAATALVSEQIGLER